MNRALQTSYPDLAPASGARAGAELVQALRLINIYRWAVAGLLLLLYFSGYSVQILNAHAPAMFLSGCGAYAAIALIGTVTIRFDWSRSRQHVYAMAGADLVTIFTLMYATSGVSSGLGMLLIVPLLGAGILLPPRMAALIASLSTLAILFQEVYRLLININFQPEFLQAGILGVLFFVTALAGSLLSLRMRESQALAKRQSIDLANLAELNEHIIEQMETGVLVLDDSARVRRANDAALSLLGAKAPVQGTHLKTLSPALNQGWHDWREMPFVDPRPIRSRDGETPLLPRFSRLGPSADAPILVLLEDERRIGERAQQMKLAALGQLTASIAHEIRNPLGAISHAGQLLNESRTLDDADRKLLEIIRRHSARINQVVENVLRLSRRERGQVSTLHLAPWLSERVREFCDGRHGTIPRFDLSQIDPVATVRVEPLQLQQVLVNLWENSVTHANPGHDPLTITLRANINALAGRTLVDVIDNGPGIPTDIIEHVFEPFYTTARTGTGLGLYIAREVCEGNGGGLTYVHTPPQGGFFRMTFAYSGLPAEQSAPNVIDSSAPA